MSRNQLLVISLLCLVVVFVFCVFLLVGVSAFQAMRVVDTPQIIYAPQPTYTSQPTYTPEPTLTRIPTATATRVGPDPVIAYHDEIQRLKEWYIEAFGRVVSFSEDRSAEEMRVNQAQFAILLGEFKRIDEAARKLHPPPVFVEFHRLFLLGTASCSEGADLAVQAFANWDPDMLDASTATFDECLGWMEAADVEWEAARRSYRMSK